MLNQFAGWLGYKWEPIVSLPEHITLKRAEELQT